VNPVPDLSIKSLKCWPLYHHVFTTFTFISQTPNLLLFVCFLSLERRLMTTNHIPVIRHRQPYFFPGLMDRRYLVEDDHIPFLEKSKLKFFCLFVCLFAGNQDKMTNNRRMLCQASFNWKSRLRRGLPRVKYILNIKICQLPLSKETTN